ncbi:MAG: hypothetical protein Q9198_003583 [Flavoplaca austrocitrina]
MRKMVWAIALPCLVVAVLGALQYLPDRQDATTANLVQRDTNNIPIPNTPLTDLRQHWSQQNLENAPALPIIGLSELYIQAIVNDTFPDLPPLLNSNTTFSSNSTPRVQQRSNGYTQKHARFHLDTSPAVLNPLLKRGEAEPFAAASTKSAAMDPTIALRATVPLIAMLWLCVAAIVTVGTSNVA